MPIINLKSQISNLKLTDHFLSLFLTFLTFITFIIISTFFTFSISAADFPSLGGVAVNIKLADSVSAGDIISVTKDGLKKTTVAYDPVMYGVIVSAPVISVEPRSDQTKPILSAGQAEVKVKIVDE